MVPMKQSSELKYVHQDHLTSTSLMTDTEGEIVGPTLKYLPFGESRNTPQEIEEYSTDKLFTGQRLDSTGLYYYGARYYDPEIVRFISPDTIIPNPANPQSFNRYSYCLNNPLKYIDSSGHVVEIMGWDIRTIDALQQAGFMSPYMVGYEEITAVISSAEYHAYDTFRKHADVDKLRIQTLEQSKEHVISIIFYDLGPNPSVDAKTEKNGNNYEVTLNNNTYKDMTRVNDFFVSMEINKQIEDYILICYPAIELPNPIEFVPLIGTVYSIVNTQNKYNSREISFSDAFLSYDGILIGWNSYPAGLVAKGLLTTYNFAQDSRIFYELAQIYGYPFR
jgi:RHS repeat-associated protein